MDRLEHANRSDFHCARAVRRLLKVTKSEKCTSDKKSPNYGNGAHSNARACVAPTRTLIKITSHSSDSFCAEDTDTG